MLSDEEKQALDKLKRSANYFVMPIYETKIILELIEKQSKETEEYKKQLDLDNECEIALNSKIMDLEKEIEHQKEKRENQKQELAILNAKQVEFNKLVNTVNSYKGQFKKQQKEIEELKNGQIDFWISDKEIEERIKNKFVSKDKIKAKIEEVSDGTYDAKIILQSLLEKE